jgi:hypothetical protein
VSRCVGEDAQEVRQEAVRFVGGFQRSLNLVGASAIFRSDNRSIYLSDKIGEYRFEDRKARLSFPLLVFIYRYSVRLQVARRLLTRSSGCVAAAAEIGPRR